MFPPGRARLGTSPVPTGSPLNAMTIGIVLVSFLAARTAGPPVATIMSTLRRTNSVARLERSSTRYPPNRHSISMFLPST